MISTNLLFKTSLGALRSNKTRSALTILGIVIGISAVILIMGIGQGAQDLILGELNSFGAEMIIVRPGQEPSGPTDISGTLFADSLKSKDVEALGKKSNAPFISGIAPFVLVTGSVAYQSETMQPQIFGGDARFMSQIFGLNLAEGSLYTEADIKQRASVAIIGSDVREELFGLSDAVGEKIKVRGKNFRVVGVFEKRGQVAFADIDNIVMIPDTTAQTYLLGIDYYHEVIVTAQSPELVSRTVRDIEATLREQHGIDNPDKDDFFVVTQEGVVAQIESILGALTAFLSSVVAISLVVGGVGVMNVMLVAVTERTREIGLRKAVGANNKDILSQFLLEAIMLTGIGGIVGVTIGYGFLVVVSIVLSSVLDTNWVANLSLGSILLGIGVATMVGLVFGLYPARKASKMSPIEALRYE
jgi:putative ABC transport system permease protein